VSLGGIDKRKGLSSQDILIISMKFLWITMSPLVIKPRQWPSNIPLKQKRKRSKEIKIRVKGNEWVIRGSNFAQKFKVLGIVSNWTRA
jgi:hypothetical protein